MSAVFGFLAPMLVLLLLGLIAAAIVGLMRGRLTFATIVHAYTAVVLGACIVLALAGGALLLKSLFSAAFGLDFSYQTVDYPRGTPPPGVVEPKLPSAAERAASEAGDDLTGGITLLVLGGGLGALHAFGKLLAARRDTSYARVVAGGFDVAMLVIGTVVGLVSSAMLLNDLLRRYVVTSAASAPYTMPRPGGALGFALMFVPLWVYFARRVWRTLAGGTAPATPQPPTTPVPESPPAT